jgi:hypothetical protein
VADSSSEVKKKMPNLKVWGVDKKNLASWIYEEFRHSSEKK